jgi:hypothetical protein
MVFVDGENLAIRYGKTLQENGWQANPYVVHMPDVLVWHPLCQRA